jgi:2-polyprenyl-6-methoxyphenol hydroxylase-like FAD-dependent oxidoreductase
MASSKLYDVLIAGGGPVGLALAVELGLRGATVLLTEKSERIGQQPRAKTTNIRSMEHMRRWGVADAIKARAPLPVDYPRDIRFATRLFGHPIARIEHALFMSPPRDDRYAEPSQWIPQYAVEEVLREKAASLPGVTLRFGTAVSGIAQSCDAVTATLIPGDGGASAAVSARYLVGADGARSPTREAIGARMTGDHGFTSFLGLVVKAPGLGAAVPLGEALMYLIINPDGAAMMGPMDHNDMWFWMQPTAAGVKVERDEAHRRFAASIGRAQGQEWPFEIVTMDPWLAHRLIADKYRDRRIFLAGDACHLHPPFGGYGMNMGLGDAVDLGWKLAAMLQGWGGPKLLESYEIERRPVHQRTIDEAVENLNFFGHHFARGDFESDTPEGQAARAAMAPDIIAAKTREFRALGIVLGQGYEGSPIVVPDGTSAPAFDPMTYLPSARPGQRAPHAWLSDTRSLYDTFGAGFTLLVPEAAANVDETTALTMAARRLGAPLAVVTTGHGGLGALYGARCALIRPDGHVAWRGDRMRPQDCDMIMRIVCGW